LDGKLLKRCKKCKKCGNLKKKIPFSLILTADQSNSEKGGWVLLSLWVKLDEFDDGEKKN